MFCSFNYIETLKAENDILSQINKINTVKIGFWNEKQALNPYALTVAFFPIKKP